ncbi:hypothetical protein Dimus_018243, partial [Dionaea muscipula]
MESDGGSSRAERKTRPVARHGNRENATTKGFGRRDSGFAGLGGERTKANSSPTWIPSEIEGGEWKRWRGSSAAWSAADRTDGRRCRRWWSPSGGRPCVVPKVTTDCIVSAEFAGTGRHGGLVSGQ